MEWGGSANGATCPVTPPHPGPLPVGRGGKKMPSATTTPSSARSRFLDLRALSALAHRRFVTKHNIEGSYSGRHRSKQQGGAAEFVDYREYAAGEDLRRLDWKV